MTVATEGSACIAIRGGTPLHGAVALGPDPAITQAALLLCSLCEGASELEDPDAFGADAAAMRAALCALGVATRDEASALRIEGQGLSGWRMAERGSVDCGASLSTLALLAGALCARPFGTRLTLRTKPSALALAHVVGALHARGAQIAESIGGGQGASVAIAPLLQEERLHPIECALPEPDVHAKGAVLLSGLFTDAPTSVSEPLLSPDHVERLLMALEVPLRRLGSMAGFDPAEWTGELRAPGRLSLPADPDAAAFVAAAASAIPGSRIALLDVSANPTRSGFVDALRLFGGRLRVISKGDRAGREPIAEVQVQSARTRGGAMGGEIALRCGDGLAALAPLGAASVRGLQLYDGEPLAPSGSPFWDELAALLRAFGIAAAPAGAGLVVAATERLHAARVDARGDHRLAFTAVVCGLCAEGETQVENAGSLLSRSPRVVPALRELGARILVEGGA